MGKYINIINFILLLSLLSACNKGIDEPILPDENTSNSITSFDFQNVTPTSRQILVEWTAINAVKFDVIVNDTVSIKGIQTNSYLLTHLEPNTTYKISVRAYDKNNYSRIVNKNSSTSIELINEISSLPFGKYEYKTINIIQCKVTSDNNYIILGQALIYDKTYTLVMKTDRNFNLIWKKYFEGGLFDYTANNQYIKECDDNGFLVLSYQNTFKINKYGDKIIQIRNEITYKYAIYNGIETANGNFLFVGNNGFNLIDNKLDTIWSKPNNYYLNIEIIKNGKNNFYVFGTKLIDKNSGLDGMYNLGMKEIDNSGNVLQEIIYNNTDNCYLETFVQSKDNYYYLMANGAGYTSDMSVSKITNKGDELWTVHTLSTIGFPLTVYGATALKDNSILCLCYSSSQNYYAVEISPDGKLIKKFNAGDMYVPVFIDKADDGSYIFLTQGGYIYKLVTER